MNFCFAEFRIEIINSPSVPPYTMSEYRLNLKVLVHWEGFVTLLYMEMNNKNCNTTWRSGSNIQLVTLAACSVASSVNNSMFSSEKFFLAPMVSVRIVFFIYQDLLNLCKNLLWFFVWRYVVPCSTSSLKTFTRWSPQKEHKILHVTHWNFMSGY